MTEQEIFDTVANHLLTQKAKAKLNPYENMCAYRSYDGLKCAVGCLIPDSVYDPSMETNTVQGLLNAFPSLAVYLGSDTELLAALQHVHDDEEISEWKQHLVWIADEFGLDNGILKESNS